MKNILLILIFILLSNLSLAFAVTCESILSPFYRTANPTAQFSAREYDEPNSRPASMYTHILFKPLGTTLEDFVPEGSFLVELGSGIGLGMRQLAERKPLQRVLLMNTQDLSDYLPLYPPVEYVVGWAEEKIAELEDNSVDRFIDLWGAFAYSPDKPYLIEQAYKKLKPGGKAVLLHPAEMVPTLVVKGSRIEDLTWYVLAHAPDGVFHYYETHAFNYHAKVFEISKPLVNAPELKLGLRVIKAHVPAGCKFPQTRLEPILP